MRPVGPVAAQDAASQGNLGFIHAFVASISVIIVSELGDKTFFIAAIMAMRYNRLTVLAGAMLALGLMTCLSGACVRRAQLAPVLFENDSKLICVSVLCVLLSAVWLRHNHHPQNLHVLCVHCSLCHLWHPHAARRPENEPR